MRLMKRGDFGVEYAELTFKDQVLLCILAVELVDQLGERCANVIGLILRISVHESQ